MHHQVVTSPRTPEELLAGNVTGLAALAWVRRVLAGLDPAVEERTSRSQVAFRRTRGFAYLWAPGRYLAHPGAEAVLSIALPRELRSARFKEVVHPAASTWMHHLEVHDPADLDTEVAGWLLAAADAAARQRR